MYKFIKLLLGLVAILAGIGLAIQAGMQNCDFVAAVFGAGLMLIMAGITFIGTMSMQAIAAGTHVWNDVVTAILTVVVTGFFAFVCFAALPVIAIVLAITAGALVELAVTN